MYNLMNSCKVTPVGAALLFSDDENRISFMSSSYSLSEK